MGATYYICCECGEITSDYGGCSDIKYYNVDGKELFEEEEEKICQDCLEELDATLNEKTGYWQCTLKPEQFPYQIQCIEPVFLDCNGNRLNDL